MIIFVVVVVVVVVDEWLFDFFNFLC